MEWMMIFLVSSYYGGVTVQTERLPTKVECEFVGANMVSSLRDATDRPGYSYRCIEVTKR